MKLGDGEEGDEASDSDDELCETDDYCEDIVSIVYKFALCSVIKYSYRGVSRTKQTF